MSEATDLLAAIRFNSAGLVPALAQQHDTGEALMLAWMNRASIVNTLATGRVCYRSQSRQTFWRKGETSGQVQNLVEMRLDCDGVAVLLVMDQYGAACRTGRWSCFHRAARDGRWDVAAAPLVSPEQLYTRTP